MLRIANPLKNKASSCMCVQTWFQIWLGFSFPAQQETDMFTLAQLPPKTSQGLCQSAVRHSLWVQSHTGGRFYSTLETEVRWGQYSHDSELHCTSVLLVGHISIVSIEPRCKSDPTSITPLCDWNYSKVLNQDSLCSVQIQIWLRLLYFTIARLKELILKNTPFKYRNVCVMVIMLQHLASARETLLLLPFLYLEEPPHHVCFQNWPEAFLSAPGVGQDRLQGLKFCAVNKSAGRTGQACDLRLLCICMRWSSVRTLF